MCFSPCLGHKQQLCHTSFAACAVIFFHLLIFLQGWFHSPSVIRWVFANSLLCARQSLLYLHPTGTFPKDPPGTLFSLGDKWNTMQSNVIIDKQTKCWLIISWKQLFEVWMGSLNSSTTRKLAIPLRPGRSTHCLCAESQSLKSEDPDWEILNSVEMSCNFNGRPHLLLRHGDTLSRGCSGKNRKR